MPNLTAPKWTAPNYRNPNAADVLNAEIVLGLAAQDGSYSAMLLLAEIKGGR